jgi:hypothetical protein
VSKGECVSNAGKVRASSGCSRRVCPYIYIYVRMYVYVYVYVYVYIYVYLYLYVYVYLYIYIYYIYIYICICMCVYICVIYEYMEVLKGASRGYRHPLEVYGGYRGPREARG